MPTIIKTRIAEIIILKRNESTFILLFFANLFIKTWFVLVLFGSFVVHILNLAIKALILRYDGDINTTIQSIESGC